MSNHKSSMNDFYVYQYLRCRDSEHGLVGSPYYVGKGRGHRAYQQHYKGIRKPSNPANIQILANNMSEADAFQAEMLLIHLHGRIDKGTGCLQNRTDGGEGPVGHKHSEAARARMSIAKLGRKTGPHTSEWNAHIAESQTGRAVSQETRDKISTGRKGIKPAPRSKSHCEAIRKAKLGKERPDMLSGSSLQRKSAMTRKGKKRGSYKHT